MTSSGGGIAPKELLGHASIVQTLSYAEVAREDADRSAAKHVDAFTAAVGEQAA
jgi:hypothetical protein